MTRSSAHPSSNDRSRVSRARWAAGGAAVAVALGAGGLSMVGSTDAASSTGERDVFVPITPCRLFDTRAASVIGSRSSPLGPAETIVEPVTGTNGNCVVPGDASGVAMNVTTDHATAPSYLTVWPSDAPRPLASNLNWVAGSPPTPNKVDVRLSATGTVSLFNNGGTIDVIADVVGYYVDHNHDDRYYTKAESDARFAPAAVPTTVPGVKTVSVAIGGPAFQSGDPTNVVAGTQDNGCRFIKSYVLGPPSLDASIELPVGATIIEISAMLGNAQISPGVLGYSTVRLIRRTVGSSTQLMEAFSDGKAPGPYIVTGFPSPVPTTATGQFFFLRWTPTNVPPTGVGAQDVVVCGAELTYTIPG